MNTIVDKDLVERAISKLIYYFKQCYDIQILAYCHHDDKFIEFLVREVINVVGALYSEDYYLLLLRKRDNQWWFSLIQDDIRVIEWSAENKDNIAQVSSNYLELIADLKEEIEVQKYIDAKLEEMKQ